jgi:hypothetical protein
MRTARFPGRWGLLGLAALAAFVLGSTLYAPDPATEHPTEHPTAKPAEHPAAAQPAKLTTEALAEAIADYVSKDAELKGGYFLVYDALQKKPLALTLDKVHKEQLAHIGEGVYFACADFKATDGHLYDLDIFMKQTDAGLKVTQVLVHKQDGQPRYTWYEEGGIWKRKVAEEGSAAK